MKKLIYPVCIGPKSKLYEYCTESVKAYAEKIGADYIIQKDPILRITPNPFLNQREGKTGGWKKIGYMPIFEKENVFNYFKDYNMCCVVDADIYIKQNSPDIFKELDQDFALGSIYECDLPINDQYAQKINSYSRMLSMFQLKWDIKQRTGYSFFNSGVMLYNSNKMIKILKGMSPKEFLDQYELQDFINGIGPFKWQSDQMTLNYWFKKNKVDVQRMNWKWNCLYTTVNNEDLKNSYFIHFFLKDHLPNKGENVDELRKLIE
jgi:lipopolysaccharide biosynthesis glycosyltransferase